MISLFALFMPFNVINVIAETIHAVSRSQQLRTAVHVYCVGPSVAH